MMCMKKEENFSWKIADALECSYDKNTTGMFVWAKTPEGVKAEKMVDDLLYNKDYFYCTWLYIWK